MSRSDSQATTTVNGGEGNPSTTDLTTTQEKYVYDGDHVVLDFRRTARASTLQPWPAATCTARPSTGAGAGERAGTPIDASDRVYWFLTDNLGTVRDIVNQQGHAVAGGHYQYTAFGQLLAGDTALTRYLYTGREFDATTGLQYNRHRWYDPHSGRFLSEDPIKDGKNWYAYAGSNPTNGTDPSGLAPTGKAARTLIRGLERLGVREWFQVHHIIGNELFGRAEFAAWFAKLGIKSDSASNLIALPNNLIARALSGRSLHNGRHLGEYVAAVESRLQSLLTRHGAGEINDDAARAGIQGIQQELRQGLSDGTILLQQADLDALAKGNGVSVLGLFAIVPQTEWDQAVERAGYLTAEHYLGKDSWTGWLIDIFNPLTIVQDIMTVAPYLTYEDPDYPTPGFSGP